jgi:hypothetical protein
MNMMILMTMTLQMIHLVTSRNHHHLKKKAQKLKKVTKSQESEEDSEEEVEDDLHPKSEPSDKEESYSEHSRGSGSNPSNEKSKDGSSHSDETKPGSESESDDPFREPEPGPSHPRRSSRVPKPTYKSGNVYGNKPAIQIEKEIQSDRAWQKAIDPKAKIAIKQVHNTMQDDLDKLIKEGGSKSIHFMLAQAVDMEKNPRDLHYRDILRILNQKLSKNGY